MIFRFTDPKIVIKSLFLILTIFKNNKKPHIFTPPLPSGRGGVKICVFFVIFDILHHENMIYTDYYIFQIFANEFHLVVARLGLESIEL